MPTTKAKREQESEPRPIDVVALVSLRADGTPDQGEGFVVIGDEPDPA